MALEFDPFDEIEMCEICGEDEEWDFGMCISCAEEKAQEISLEDVLIGLDFLSEVR